MVADRRVGGGIAAAVTLGGSLGGAGARGAGAIDRPARSRHRLTPMLSPIFLAAALAIAPPAADARAASATPPNVNIPLWDAGQVPLAMGNGPLDAPSNPFLPPESKRNGAAVIVAPGGGNIMLMYGGEGLEVAERLNAGGTRRSCSPIGSLRPKPARPARSTGSAPMQLVRARAAEWKMDPAKIGFAGFSAGSSLGDSSSPPSTPGEPAATDRSRGSRRGPISS